MSFPTRRRVYAVIGLGAAFTAAALTAAAGPAAADQPAGNPLVASGRSPDPIKPGGTGTLRYELTNTGSAPTEGIHLSIQLPRYVSMPDAAKDKHCEFTSPDHLTISCSFTDAQGKLAPGQTLRNDAPVQVARNAPGPTDLGNLVAIATPLDRGGKLIGRDDPGGKGAVSLPIRTGGNSYDLAITLADASGAKGDIVTVKGSTTNAGPSDNKGGDVFVVAPTGTEIAGLPDGCKIDSDKRKGSCHTDYVLPAGGKAPGELKFRITGDKVGGEGFVTVKGGPGTDTNPKNNTAPIRITVTGGSGGPGASPSGSNGSGTGNGGGSGSGGGDRSGSLPITGTDIGLLAGLGAALLLLSGFLIVLARRRRQSTR